MAEGGSWEGASGLGERDTEERQKGKHVNCEIGSSCNKQHF